MKTLIPIVLIVAFLTVAYLVFIKFYTKAIKSKNLIYDLENGNEIKSIKDIVYKSVPGKPLLMDVYQPVNADKNRKVPAVIMIHGDGSESYIRDAKDWAMFRQYGRLIAGNGLACVTFNHRAGGMVSGYNKIKEASEDVLNLVDHVRRNADAWNIDENRICIWGFSSGSIYLSLFLGSMPEYVKCIVSYYGLLDAKAWTKKNEAVLKRYYPENYLSSGSIGKANLMVVKAGRDTKCILKSIDSFIDAARSNRIEFSYIIHPNGKHSFDIMNDDEETRKIIGRTLDFVKQNI